MKTLTSEMKQELLYQTLITLGHKVLLKNYECDFGEIDFVTKRNGTLWFIGLNRDRKKMEKVASYYIKRYGIKDVPYEIAIL